MIILDGKKLAEKIKAEVSEHSQKYFEQYKTRPKLAVLLIGENSPSLIYIKNKRKACEECHIDTELYHLPEETNFETLRDLIERLNNDECVNGILVQFPLPNHIDQNDIIHMIAPEKDVDGFGPANLGGSWLGKPMLEPCTPKGIMALLDAYDIDVTGKHAVIIGRSNIVGKPVAGLLLSKDATVTITHSKTKNLKQIVSHADIVVVAIGQPHMITKEWLKKDAVVIDVGINRCKKNGAYKLIGDVDYDDVKDHVFALSPVPGGVGPMTVVSLLQNVLIAAFAQHGQQLKFE